MLRGNWEYLNELYADRNVSRIMKYGYMKSRDVKCFCLGKKNQKKYSKQDCKVIEGTIRFSFPLGDLIKTCSTKYVKGEIII